MTGEEIKATKLTKLIQRLFVIDFTLTKETSQLVTEYNEIIEEIGIITSVDKNFFGTTALYIKTTETTEEQYCIEDNKLAEVAKENIGKKVRVNYGTRVGIYSTGACDNAPVDIIEVINEENNVKGN